MFLQRPRRFAEHSNVRAATQIFCGDIRPPAGDLNVQRMPQIFSGKNNFSAEPFDCSVAVSSFLRSAQGSADDLNFRPHFSVFASCSECAAELVKLRRHFYFSARCDFLPPERNRKTQKKEEPGQSSQSLENRPDSFNKQTRRR
jgi:hypothetical protein